MYLPTFRLRATKLPEKSNVFTFFPLKSLCDHNRACRKIGKGQPKVIIYTNMMELSFRCYILSFIEISPPVPEKNIFKVFTIYGHGSHLSHVT